MPTLRRILKYTPAEVLGLLVIVWIIGVVTPFRVIVFGQLLFDSASGTVGPGVVTYPPNWPNKLADVPFRVRFFSGERLGTLWLGTFHIANHESELTGVHGRQLLVPALALITTLLPFAIGPFISFRFRLWHYLVYTALVAVELGQLLAVTGVAKGESAAWTRTNPADVG